MSQDNTITLFSYWRSSCSWRVRIALNMKDLEYEYKAVNLLKKEHVDPEFMKLNPSGKVPTLAITGRSGDDGKKEATVLNQSIAIMEYLEEQYPNNGSPLLPSDPVKRARVREIVQIVASDTQPIQNLGVVTMVQEITGGSQEKRMEWAKHWITRGLQSVEKILEKTAGTYAVGDEVTMADICIIPQLYNARRFGVDMDQFPIALRIEQTCAELPAFQKAHPDNQPDAVVN